MYIFTGSRCRISFVLKLVVSWDLQETLLQQCLMVTCSNQLWSLEWKQTCTCHSELGDVHTVVDVLFLTLCCCLEPDGTRLEPLQDCSLLCREEWFCCCVSVPGVVSNQAGLPWPWPMAVDLWGMFFTNRAARLWTISILATYFCWCGSQILEQYSSFGRTVVL